MSRPNASELLSAIRIAPSILSADFARLGAQVSEVIAAGARVIHVDVMDGHFVPPITMGPIVVSALADEVHAAGALLDVHLMIERPERQVAEFAKAGADSITVHAEATPHLNYALGAIKEAGANAAAAVNPGTPASVLGEVGDLLDMALCMSVNPGWGGQPFLSSSLDKLARLRALLPASAAIEVDGGVDVRTAGACARHGANVLVAGSAIFGQADPAAAYAAIAQAAGAV
ncbi:ribulose-phosphate 3-epimerase [Conexibacter stalactiti]|uniref:Ribulose-phosphate 3-epimerase n=1 Tax=Conexibacter stalactiti TaxID=1940611 RepID=A0ABU4HZ31_9ACTN|nr:ribulose-phosphate 3-epimerase [Conexibacter stalactiti]MDW5597740.1 ribulose-phosphate 3-epimerase [Conexibacter stalactiti]MEC5038382.1 ribulose-phosphate 3-epimerase [Conexibacter stalactiti]